MNTRFTKLNWRINMIDMSEYKVGDYIIIELSNGLNIIGQYEKDNSNGIYINNPVRCLTEDSEIYLTSMFNGMSSSKEMFFQYQHITTLGLVDKDIENYYNRYLKDIAEEFGEFKKQKQDDYLYKNTSNTDITTLSNLIKVTIH